MRKTNHPLAGLWPFEWRKEQRGETANQHPSHFFACRLRTRHAKTLAVSQKPVHEGGGLVALDMQC